MIGDCSVAKKSVMSGSVFPPQYCSGWMKRNIRTSPAGEQQAEQHQQVACASRRETFTSIKVAADPTATGMTANGVTVSTAVR